ncbi:MAG: hypothetical protein HYU54_01550 [Actinobacteria bacterium]|nr:hypothetical protein [Actinomycetota bacterium]
MGFGWDAIVVGASFAGLASAMELAGAGRILVIDRQPVGEGETSACGTLLRVLERLDAMDALEQVHEEIVLHLPGGGTYGFRPRFPFATFDYRRLCESLWARTDAVFLHASVTGVTDGAVATSSGTLRAPVLIDASGWRAVLGSSLRPALVPDPAGSLGVELRLPVREEGLHFWLLPPEIGCGVIWLFPAGEDSRVGIACYLGKGGLKSRLEEYLDDRIGAGSTVPTALRGRDPPGPGVRPSGRAGGPEGPGRGARSPGGPGHLSSDGTGSAPLLPPAGPAAARAAAGPTPFPQRLRPAVRGRSAVQPGAERLLADRRPRFPPAGAGVPGGTDGGEGSGGRMRIETVSASEEHRS